MIWPYYPCMNKSYLNFEKIQCFSIKDTIAILLEYGTLNRNPSFTYFFFILRFLFFRFYFISLTKAKKVTFSNLNSDHKGANLAH